MPGPRRNLSLHLELDSDSLSGTVSSDGEDGERFHNWLELMSAVEGRRPMNAAPPEAGSNGDGTRTSEEDEQ